MSNRYEKADTTLFIRKIMRDMKKMKAELNEHRYSLERNVARETECLLKRLTLLESCNATLSGKLAAAQREITALRQQASPAVPVKDMAPEERPAKLYVMSKQTQRAAGQGLYGEWGGHATAA